MADVGKASMDNYDLVIVGGGIGGSALAAVMARAGRSVLVLERSEMFEDVVRGEWIAPWGVTEVRRVGLLDLLTAAGGHHITHHVTYDEHVEPAQAEAATLPLGLFAPDVPGPLAIGHPHHCQTLFDEAARCGATVVRGVDVQSVTLGASPSVTYAVNCETRQASARLVVGADGRNSTVREAAGIVLHADKPHHMFGGMLVRGVAGDDRKQTIGVEGDFNFLTFPQGSGMVRVYGSYSLDDRGRFAGPDGARRFLDSFRMACCPENELLVAGEPAGPLRSYTNNDAWTDEPFAEGAVLIGDAAGWNDPIVGQGLSITYRDVRIVSELLLGAEVWPPALFAPYAEERAERMRRLRFAAALAAAIDAEFGDAASARRRSYHERAAADPSLRSHLIATLAGPEAMPAEAFTPAHRERVLGLNPVS
jgi:2-polyprenyl-6-methoxyphenol hydroxylase-like FAD-dependent oxidoreductase